MNSNDEMLKLAEHIRRACVNAASDAAEQAGIQGLCEDGQVEAAISALQMLDLEKILADTNDMPEN